MEHVIEHATGIYIGLLLLACVVGIALTYVSHLPYTIGLTLVGLAIGFFYPTRDVGLFIAETGFSHDLIFFVFLPPLLFQGALHMELNRLLRHIGPIACFAVPGVIVSTLLVGGIMGWLTGEAFCGMLLFAFLFGALISPTDPVSVLALFKQADAPNDLRTMVEGESLFNDATGVVVFTILLEAAMLEEGISAGHAIFVFFKVSLGGLCIGAALGATAFAVLKRLDDHLLENAICIVLAFGSFWVAEVFHCSGVISTVMAGLLIGNYGRRFSMNRKTTNTVENFFESVDFLINSFLFILIGLELRAISAEKIEGSRIVLAIVAIAAMLIARAAVVYTFYWGLNQVGRRRPKPWKHILFWGGLRGSIPIALLLGLPSKSVLDADHLLVQARPALLFAGFACVSFSLVVQGLTMMPLMRALGIGGEEEEDEE